MKRRTFLHKTSLASTGLYLLPDLVTKHQEKPESSIPVGIIGLDTSHAIAFTKVINTLDEHGQSTGYKVTHAYPHGSKDIESSVSRIPRYTKEIMELGVEVVHSIAALLKEVDVVLLETNDGRLHLEQAKAVFEAKKLVFIDKPLAASFKDAIAIFELAKKHQVPVFSASSLRFSPSMKAIQTGKIGKVLGADTYSPAKLEPTHPDLFWYGIHGVESLFAIMGTGCKSVRRIYTKDTDIVIGEWEDGRIGTFRGLRTGKTNYGGKAFGTEGIAEGGLYEGYEHLVKEIIQFFKTGIPPVSAAETLEIFAFMEAAEISKRRNGKRVNLARIMKKVRKE